MQHQIFEVVVGWLLINILKHLLHVPSEVIVWNSDAFGQGLSQDLETGCPKLAVVNFLGGQSAMFLRGFTIYTDFNHKHV